MGLSRAFAKRIVKAVPPEGTPLVRTRVPSESRTFHSVRCAVSPESVSVSGYRFPIRPSSAYRSLGHHPPHGIPIASAASSAARSTPDCPPETIFLKRSGPTAAHLPSSGYTKTIADGLVGPLLHGHQEPFDALPRVHLHRGEIGRLDLAVGALDLPRGDGPEKSFRDEVVGLLALVFQHQLGRDPLLENHGRRRKSVLRHRDGHGIHLRPVRLREHRRRVRPKL